MTEGNYYKYYRGTELIGYEAFSGERKYYSQDAHGNVTGLLDCSGAEEKSYDYNAYGKEEAFTYNPMGNDTIIFQWKAKTEKVHNPFGYCGEYTDEETGLVYLRNRYYDPSIGRFISEDPIRDGLNWYVYCVGNPNTFVDPFGLGVILSYEYLEDFKGYVCDIYGSSDLEFIIEDSYKSKKNIKIIGVEYNKDSDRARSITGMALLNYMFAHKKNVEISFGHQKSLTINMEACISEKAESDDVTIESHIIHELTHVYTNLCGYDQILTTGMSMAGCDTTGDEAKQVKEKYKEATAITVEEKFRSEMGYPPRSPESGIIGINGYGMWPWTAVKDPRSDFYGIITFKESISMMQGPFIWYDIQKNGNIGDEGK